MNFEDMQKAWQAHGAGAKITIDPEVLLKEVRRNQWSFRRTIFWRDAREVVVAAFLTWLFLHWGLRDRLWPLFLLSFICFGVGAFMLVDRLVQRKKQPAPNDSLKACAETSLFHVNHQIWLLKNVVWWYLLPLGIGMETLFAYFGWRALAQRGAPASAIIMVAAMSAGCALLYWGIYWLNQMAVRKNLEPRRQELEKLLASLN